MLAGVTGCKPVETILWFCSSTKSRMISSQPGQIKCTLFDYISNNMRSANYTLQSNQNGILLAQTNFLFTFYSSKKRLYTLTKSNKQRKQSE